MFSKEKYIGIDIGETKCAIVRGGLEYGKVTVEKKVKFPTADCKSRDRKSSIIK